MKKILLMILMIMFITSTLAVIPSQVSTLTISPASGVSSNPSQKTSEPTKSSSANTAKETLPQKTTQKVVEKITSQIKTPSPENLKAATPPAKPQTVTKNKDACSDKITPQDCSQGDTSKLDKDAASAKSSEVKSSSKPTINKKLVNTNLAQGSSTTGGQPITYPTSQPGSQTKRGTVSGTTGSFIIDITGNAIVGTASKPVSTPASTGGVSDLLGSSITNSKCKAEYDYLYSNVCGGASSLITSGIGASAVTGMAIADITGNMDLTQNTANIRNINSVSAYSSHNINSDTNSKSLYGHSGNSYSMGNSKLQPSSMFSLNPGQGVGTSLTCGCTPSIIAFLQKYLQDLQAVKNCYESLVNYGNNSAETSVSKDQLLQCQEKEAEVMCNYKYEMLDINQVLGGSGMDGLFGSNSFKNAGSSLSIASPEKYKSFYDKMYGFDANNLLHDQDCSGALHKDQIAKSTSDKTPAPKLERKQYTPQIAKSENLIEVKNDDGTYSSSGEVTIKTFDASVDYIAKLICEDRRIIDIDDSSIGKNSDDAITIDETSDVKCNTLKIEYSYLNNNKNIKKTKTFTLRLS